MAGFFGEAMTSGNVNVRTKPDTKLGLRIATLPINTKVWINAGEISKRTNKKWYQVANYDIKEGVSFEIKDLITGWVIEDYLKDIIQYDPLVITQKGKFLEFFDKNKKFIFIGAGLLALFLLTNKKKRK